MSSVASMRSWLFVPGDSARKQEKAAASAADALILDLEDSVTVELLPQARERVREFLVLPIASVPLSSCGCASTRSQAASCPPILRR
jgi:hypothetical protein